MQVGICCALIRQLLVYLELPASDAIGLYSVRQKVSLPIVASNDFVYLTAAAKPHNRMPFKYR